MKISFEGLPGCRKHEIFLAINKRFGLTFLSSFDSDSHQRFLSNPTKYSLAYELNRLMSFYHQSNLFEITHNNDPVPPINLDYKDYYDNDDLDDDDDLDNDITNDNELSEYSDNKDPFENDELPSMDDINTDGHIEPIIISEKIPLVNTVSRSKKILYDSLYSLKKVYVEFLTHQGWMNKYEYDTFMKFYYLLYTPPDVIIYFYGTFENAFNRMKQMSQQPIISSSENDNIQNDNQLIRYNYSEEEFKKLHYQYEWVFDNNNCKIPIFKINVDDDLNVILNNIQAVLDKVDQVFKS